MSEIGRKKKGNKSSNVTADALSALLSQVYGMPTKAGIDVSPSKALQCSAVYACVGLLAESVAQLPVKVYRGFDGERMEERDNWVYRLLAHRPCPWLTSFSWRELAMFCLCLRGDFYAYKVRDAVGRVVELLPLLPGMISVRQLPTWELEYNVTFANGDTRTVGQREIFHVMYRSVDGVTGISPIACQRETIGLTLAAQEHGASTFANGAKPGGVLSIPGNLSEEAYQRLKTNWQSAYSGENAGATAILEQGTKFEALSMTNADAQFLETRRFQVEDIARIFGIPLFMIQSTEKTTSWGSGIEQMSMGYVRYTLLPWVRRWEQAIARDLIDDTGERGLEVRFNLDGLQRGDLNSRYDAYQKGINMGVLSPNEVREMEDMNPYEGGDIHLIPLNMRVDNEDNTGGSDTNAGTEQEKLPDGDQGDQ